MRASSKFESGDGVIILGDGDANASPNGIAKTTITTHPKSPKKGLLLPIEGAFNMTNEENKNKLDPSGNLIVKKISSDAKEEHGVETLALNTKENEMKKNEVMSLAATRIQTCFRGWLVRTNLKIVTKCTIKIQALWRGALARIHWKIPIEEKRREKMDELKQLKQKSQSFAHDLVLMDKKLKEGDAQTKQKIQSVAPVHRNSARTKNSLEITLDDVYRNSARIKNSLEITHDDISSNEMGNLNYEVNSAESELINCIEESDSSFSVDSLTVSSTDEENIDLRLRIEKALHCLETILKDFCGEDLERISTTRVAELVTYLDSNPAATKSDLCVANSLARMLPSVPDEENDNNKCVKPEVEKARLLKEAIRLFRQKIKTWETQKLYKYHHLARTAIIPGVYSDPFCSELTEIEKKLNGLKFHDSKDANSYVSPAKAQTENKKQLKELTKCDPDEQNTLQKIYNFKMNYFPAGNEEGINTIDFQRVKTPPPFTTFFKSKPRV